MHSPTPWYSDDNEGYSITRIYPARKTQYISIVAEVIGDSAEAESNAAFIVRAVNSYAAMVEALKAIMTGGNHLALHITNSFGEHPPFDASSEEAMEFYRVGVAGWDGNAWKYDVWMCWKRIMQARKALALAEGKEPPQ